MSFLLVYVFLTDFWLSFIYCWNEPFLGYIAKLFSTFISACVSSNYIFKIQKIKVVKFIRILYGFAFEILRHFPNSNSIFYYKIKEINKRNLILFLYMWKTLVSIPLIPLCSPWFCKAVFLRYHGIKYWFTSDPLVYFSFLIQILHINFSIFTIWEMSTLLFLKTVLTEHTM